MPVLQGLCIFVDAEGYWKTQKVPGSLKDDFNFPLIWIDIHLYEEYFKTDEMLLLSTILFTPLLDLDLFSVMVGSAMRFLERILTGPGSSIEVLCALGVC